MRQTAVLQKLSSRAARSSGSSDPDARGLAIAPPRYGIGLLDDVVSRSGLPAGLRAGIERLSGISLDGVTVHHGSSSPARFEALAYAEDKEIHLAPGQERHLPHEAWHLVQQAQGRVRPTRQIESGRSLNDDPGLEREAESMGDRAMQMAGDTEAVRGDAGSAVAPPSLAAPRTLSGSAPSARVLQRAPAVGQHPNLMGCWAAAGYSVHRNAGRQVYASLRNFVRYRGFQGQAAALGVAAQDSALQKWDNQQDNDIDEVIGGLSHNNQILTGSDVLSPFQVANFPANWNTHPMVANIVSAGVKGNHYVVLDDHRVQQQQPQLQVMDPATGQNGGHDWRDLTVNAAGTTYTTIGGDVVNAVYFTDP